MNGNDNLHHLPKGAARLLDRHFRLLREEMLNSFRSNISGFLELIGDQNNAENRKKLEKLRKGGGKFKNEKLDGGDLFVFSNVRFTEIEADVKNGIFLRVSFTQPSAKTKTAKDRKGYWRKSNKLGLWNLVCLLWPKEGYLHRGSSIESKYSIYFGTVVHRDEDLLSKDESHAVIGINFIDSSLYSIAKKEILSRNLKKENNKGDRFLVESTTLLFDSFNTVLKTLKETKPSHLPFEKYLAPRFEHSPDDEPAPVDPPIYARSPNFRFDVNYFSSSS